LVSLRAFSLDAGDNTRLSRIPATELPLDRIATRRYYAAKEFIMRRSILIVSSLDTKCQEVQFLKELIEQRGHNTLLLDMSTRGMPAIQVDISCEEVARSAGRNIEDIRTSIKNRSEITSLMIAGAIKKTIELYQEGKLAGIVGVGGVSNTGMATDIMKALPFGVPKLMVSSGAAMPSYAGGFFGSSDIAILSSVVDMAGLHELSKSVLVRAAGAICGMVETGASGVLDSLKGTGKPLVALTQFQYSEVCCDFIRQFLAERGYTVIPCHADGVGDRAMEKLLDQGIFDGVADIVPGGLSEQLFGGNRSAGPDRLEAAGKRGIPQLITPCGFEMISCGPIARKDRSDPLWISRNLAARNYFVQDAYRVQAKTNAEELRLVAKAVAEKLNKAKGPVKFFIPVRGWSSLSVKDQPLYDPNADRVFVEELKEQLKPEIELRELDTHLNTQDFAMAVVKALGEMISEQESRKSVS
jgi:uncharacterized protein (UPF0261 family)